LKRFGEAVKARNAGKCRVEIGSRRGVAGAQADELEAVDRLIRARVAHTHRAEADDEDAPDARHPHTIRSRADDCESGSVALMYHFDTA
jgi:hypothetical protein